MLLPLLLLLLLFPSEGPPVARQIVPVTPDPGQWDGATGCNRRHAGRDRGRYQNAPIQRQLLAQDRPPASPANRRTLLVTGGRTGQTTTTSAAGTGRTAMLLLSGTVGRFHVW